MAAEDQRFLQEALAQVAAQRQRFEEKLQPLEQPAYARADAMPYKLPYKLLETSQRLAFWLPKFKEAAFDFYDIASKLDIVATVKKKGKCKTYMFMQVRLFSASSIAD